MLTIFPDLAEDVSTDEEETKVRRNKGRRILSLLRTSSVKNGGLDDGSIEHCDKAFAVGISRRLAIGTKLIIGLPLDTRDPSLWD